MYYKKLFIPILSLVGSLGILLILQNTVLSQIIYPNILVHSFVLLAFTAALFFICFFSYQKYIKDKEICYYTVSLSFYILGVFTFAHAVLVPAFGWGNEALFDISEHYGFFLTSLLLWGLIIPFSEQIKENIYQARTKIFLGTTFILLVGFASLFFLPSVAEALFGSVNFFIALTGINFFVLFLVLLAKKDDSFFTSSFPSVLALLTTSTLAPFFYREWNLTWWYVHLLELSAVLLLLLLLLLRAKEGKEKLISEILFSSFSIRTRLLLIVGLTLVVIVINGAIDFRLSQNHLQVQTLENLVLMADIQEGQVFSYLDKLKNRTVDFSSDGFIRTELAKILSGDPLRREASRQAVADLSHHLLENKLPLDQGVFGIHIMDLNGKVVASSQGNEIGKEDMAMDEVFIQAKGSRYAQAFLSDIVEEVHFGENNIAILATAPIIDQSKLENIGVIMLFFKVQGLSDILRGRAQTQAGALSTWTTRTKTMEMYLVNQDKMMVSESRFIINPQLRQKVDTPPVRLCTKSEEMKGEYLDYREIPVLGASMCLANGWTLLVEIDKDEVFGTLDDYLQENLLSGSATLLLILIAIYLFILGITSPLKELSEAAQKIGKGDFTARVQLLTKDEFGRLAQVFNQMAEYIQKGSASLQEKIKTEETSRLAVTNILGDLEVTKNKLEEKAKEAEASRLAAANVLDDLEEEKKRAENFARDLEKFKMAVESTSDMVVISDPDGIALYANPATELITGYTVKETIGKKSGFLWGGYMETAYYQEMWQTIKVAKKPFISKIRNKRKNGEVYDAIIAISPVLDQKGNILFFVDTSRDITKEVEIDKAKTEFVSLASHQLRTPLSTINWYLEMLLSEDKAKLSVDQKEYTEEAAAASKRMVGLVNALLNVSRIEMGTFALTPKLINIAEILKVVVKGFEHRILEDKLLVTQDYDLSVPKVMADGSLLNIVAQNLLENAINYTPRGGKIEVSLKVQGSDILIAVADSGIGIPKNQESKIFTKLFRADNAREKEANGNGLGLYMTKAIIENSGGKIWFSSKGESASGGESGTTFYVTIPLSGMKVKIGTRNLT